MTVLARSYLRETRIGDQANALTVARLEVGEGVATTKSVLTTKVHLRSTGRLHCLKTGLVTQWKRQIRNFQANALTTVLARIGSGQCSRAGKTCQAIALTSVLARLFERSEIRSVPSSS
eukprot:sb/3476306/